MNFYDPSAENGRQVTRAVWNATITGLAAPGVTFMSAYYVLDTVRRVTQSGSLNSPGNLTEEETEAGEIRDREFPGREGCCHTGLARACVIPREAALGHRATLPVMGSGVIPNLRATCPRLAAFVGGIPWPVLPPQH